MTFRLRDFSFPNSWFVAGRYPNGNLGLGVDDEEGSVCTCSVNPGVEIPSMLLAVKDYSENVGMVQALTDLGIIGEKVAEIGSGRVNIPVHRLTDKGLALFDKGEK